MGFPQRDPTERPAQFADKEFLTDAEVAEFEQTAGARLDMDRRDDDPNRTPALVNGQKATADVERAYNDFWWDFGKNIVGTKRSSLIIDPNDGKIPRLHAGGKKRVDDDASSPGACGRGPEDRGVGERCIMGFNAGPPMLPSAYNNNVQIVQTTDYIVLHNEMVHDARIVPLAARPHGTLPQWNGDSRGHWDGDHARRRNEEVPGRDAVRRTSSPTLQLTERFTRVARDALIYEFTVNDPATWTKPWTAQIPMVSRATTCTSTRATKATTGWKAS